MSYREITVPDEGEKISVNSDFSLNVPAQPIIPYIEGDGIGVDITPVMRRVVDAAVEKSYDDSRAIAWMEIYAGEKANRLYGGDEWLPQETLDAIREFVVAIKGPLTTPVGGGYPLSQRHPASGAGSLRLSQAGTLLQRYPQPVTGAAEDRHGDLQGEFRGYLRRYRMAGGQQRGAARYRLPAG